MIENEKFIYESIFNQVRMGFLSIAEIKENIIEEIEDNEFEEEVSEEWAYGLIDKEYNKLIAESRKWEKSTDTDKLIEAFDELCKENIIALHNAGYTTSDGEYEVLEVERSLRENKLTADGYCFYHEQDLARAISPENSNLYIAFQKVENSDDKVTLAIGKRVVKVLTQKGFNVEWNETPTSKILILNFKWQYIYDANNKDLRNYDQVIELISQKKQQSKTHKNNTENSTKTKDSSNKLWSKLKGLWS